MTEEKNHNNSTERKLRQVFIYYDRFTPILSRFLQKKLDPDITAVLTAVEDGSGPVGVPPERVLFRLSSSISSPILGLDLSDAFLLGVIDNTLGNGGFNPDPLPHQWSELDERLAAPFVKRLTEILLGFSGNTQLSDSPEAVSVEKFSGIDPWYRLEWSICYAGEEYPLSFILSEDIAVLPSPEQTEKEAPKQDIELLRYIEMRRAASEKRWNADTEKDSNEKVTARVLIGSFDLTRSDLDAMKPGDILTTDIPADAPFQLIIDGCDPIPVYPGENNGQKAVILE